MDDPHLLDEQVPEHRLALPTATHGNGSLVDGRWSAPSAWIRARPDPRISRNPALCELRAHLACWRWPDRKSAGNGLFVRRDKPA